MGSVYRYLSWLCIYIFNAFSLSSLKLDLRELFRYGRYTNLWNAVSEKINIRPFFLNLTNTLSNRKYCISLSWHVAGPPVCCSVTTALSMSRFTLCINAFFYILITCRNTDCILIPAENTLSALWFTCLDYSQKRKEKEILPGFLSTLMQPVLNRVPGPIKLKPFVSSIFRPDFLWAALSVLLWPIMSITAPELSLRISGKKPLTHLPLTYSGRDQWLIKRPVWFNAES